MDQTVSESRNSRKATNDTLDESSSPRVALVPDELTDIIHQAVKDNRSYLMEHETKEILEGIGIKTTGFLIARSEDEALALSEKSGFLPL